jgi:serine/threonine-protein kinase RsbW
MEKLSALIIHADINEIPRVSAALENAMKEHAFTDEDILDVQLAVEEAITNVIVHGYKNNTGEIRLTFRTTLGLVEVQIEDTAPPFDPLSIPEPDLTGDIENRRIGGLGIFLIRQVMDGIVYRYEDGKNILVLVKRKST